jgi:pimeloyl-ACP methyl ester carboxylesterase
MRPETQDTIIRYIPKVYLEFSAMVGERISLTAYQRLSCPVLLLHGDSSPEPMRMIARQLAKGMRLVSLRTVRGAGHMGPLSHAADVCSMMANHIVRAEARLSRSEQTPEADIHRAA